MPQQDVDGASHSGEDGYVAPLDPRSQQIVDQLEAMIGPARRRAEGVARQLVGLSGKEARELAAQSRCTIRAVRVDGRSLVVTADYAPHRIDVATQDGVIVDVLSPRVAAAEPDD
jgi:hypothetical protein